MARRARRTYKEAIESVKPVATEPVLEWKTAIYARLSIENSGKDDKGESIEGQIEICKDYVEEHPYLHLVDIYCDNGWTGTNTNRPEFQRLLNDINNRKIKALVIKDFSRFSRDYIEAGNLLENVFPFMGVRFISVADNYDSFETDGSAESLLIPLKNLINSYYSKDISKKVSTAVHTKQLAGEHIPSMIPYGYMKSTTRKYRFEPDPETAANVTRIFQMRIDKVPLNHIANTFNDEGIPSPGKLRYLRGQTSDKRYETSRWSAQLIKQILRNPTYLGHLVFGRMPTALYLGKPNYQYEPDESKWRVLENMHEPLVTQEVFDKAKQMEIEGRKAWEERLEKSKEYRESNPPILKGFVYCGECGSKMRYHRYRPDQKLSGTYECPNYKYKKCGGTHSISQDKLKEIVWNVFSDQLHIFCDFEDLIQKLNHSDSLTKQQIIYKEEIQSILVKIKNRQGKRERLYEDFTEGILTPEEYQYMKQQFDKEYQELNTQYNSLQMKQQKLKKALSDKNAWYLHMQMIQHSKDVDESVLKAMVDKIIVYQPVLKERRIEVKLKYQDALAVLLSAYGELIGGKTK
ncbi:recombinase family protein [[Clostridium] innocuum]|uniref:recombinase family protein n=1 Tax=Clostridium innocuum TaxID=1522 RepID=UPI000C2FE8F1|nr:recombinase family protein [[Clostridium] innocuum]MCR0174016.1 recombinase family protein [[Clostridium] innocuum]MCR0642945.1 recombinase family protein [[Clostridium] innocuum]